MRKLMNTFVGMFAALMLMGSAFASDTNSVAESVPAESWVVSLGGSGTTVTGDDGDTALGFDLSVGRTGHLLLPLEAGVRQSVSWDSNDDSTLFSTKLYSDWTVFSIAQDTVDLFVGANVGLTYGDTELLWTAAPEAGLRWWVKRDVAVLLRAEAPFLLNEDVGFTDSVKYFLGFQVKF